MIFCHLASSFVNCFSYHMTSFFMWYFKNYMLSSKIESCFLCMFLIITVIYAINTFSKYIFNFVVYDVSVIFILSVCVCLSFLPYRMQKYSIYSSKSFIKFFMFCCHRKQCFCIVFWSNLLEFKWFLKGKMILRTLLIVQATTVFFILLRYSYQYKWFYKEQIYNHKMCKSKCPWKIIYNSIWRDTFFLTNILIPSFLY